MNLNTGKTRSALLMVTACLIGAGSGVVVALAALFVVQELR